MTGTPTAPPEPEPNSNVGPEQKSQTANNQTEWNCPNNVALNYKFAPTKAFTPGYPLSYIFILPAVFFF